MKEIIINHIYGYPQLIANIMQSIATFNKTGEGLTDLERIEYYVAHYDAMRPAVYNYTTQPKPGNKLEIYADDEMLLSISMVEKIS